MKHNPITVMFAEHDVIKQTEEIVNRVEGLWNDEPETYAGIIGKLIEFYGEYADGYHHHKEEEILFPAVSDHPDFTLHEIVEEFLNHHESFREYAAEIREGLEEKDYVAVHKVLHTYLNDLLDHIAAENEELFVLAESLMSEQELETLYFRFMDIDRELGEERKKELEKYPQQIAALIPA
jgi:hemerythrin-like domain-containing protein